MSTLLQGLFSLLQTDFPNSRRHQHLCSRRTAPQSAQPHRPLLLEKVPVTPHRLDVSHIISRAGLPVADSGCRPALWPSRRLPHPSVPQAAIDTTRTPGISHQTCETDCPPVFGAADNLPGAETIVRRSSPHRNPLGETTAVPPKIIRAAFESFPAARNPARLRLAASSRPATNHTGPASR